MEDKKICIKCKKRETRDNYSYCNICYNKYKRNWCKENKDKLKKYREARLKDTVYMFIPVNERFEGEVLNIGSTTDIYNRIILHVNGYTRASTKLKGINYNVVYANVEGLNNREELYFIEYYLIHKYFLIYGENPIANARDTFKHNICTSRQFELILIADKLIFKEYNVLNHKKNAFKCWEH